jgi:hypothetical protein
MIFPEDQIKPTPLFKRRLFAEFTQRQQDFLLLATTQGVALDHDLASPARVKALLDAGLIHKRTSRKGRSSWRTTDEGRAIVMAHVPKLLARRSQYGYTHMPHRAMFGEPEAA